MLLGAHDGASALFVAERIRRALDEPFVLADDLTLQLETSIGIAIFPRHGEDAEQLLKHADIALYASKESHMRPSCTRRSTTSTPPTGSSSSRRSATRSTTVS